MDTICLQLYGHGWVQCLIGAVAALVGSSLASQIIHKARNSAFGKEGVNYNCYPREECPFTKTQNNFITNILYPFRMSFGVEMYIFLEFKYECAFRSPYLSSEL